MDGNDIKILHIASGDLWAGAEAQLFTLASHLKTLDNTSIYVILLNHGTLEKKLLGNGIPVVVLDETRLSGLAILRKMIAAVAEIHPDVIHTHRSKENIFGSIAARLNGNIPTLRTAHGAPEHKPRWQHLPKRAIVFMDQFCGRFLQKKTVAVSQDLAVILKKSLPANRIIVIENGIDINSFSPKVQANATNTEADTPLRITIAGRLSAVKRVDIFLRTAQLLKQKHPELSLSFHIYGDGPLRQNLEALNHQLQTVDIVHFEGHCSDIKIALEETDLLMMTSDHEGLPMILLEAMATQTPILAHAVGGITNLLKNGDCGLLVNENSPESYTVAIAEFAQNPGKRAQIAQQAYTRLTKHYSAEQNASVYLRVYKNLLL